MTSNMRLSSWPAAIAGMLILALGGCTPSGPRSARTGASDVAAAAQKTYVAPGDLDEYYMFSSGGHSGQVFVFGLPSMRHIVTIPVFTPYPGTGYGFDDDSKKMLGGLTWGDAHHPALSETKGDYDGCRTRFRPTALLHRCRPIRRWRRPKLQPVSDAGCQSSIAAFAWR